MKAAREKFLANWLLSLHIVVSVVSTSRTLSSHLSLSIMRMLLLVVFVLSYSALYAQHPVFKATRLTLQDGLSDNMVLCALQDKQGFMWFGTRNGLNRYDGYHITVFRHNRNDPYSLSNESIQSLFEDSRGRMWIGTAEGLNMFDPVLERFTYYQSDSRNPNGILQGAITSIAEDRWGCLWLATDNTRRGIQKLDTERGVFTTYRHNPEDPYSLTDDGVTGICRDKNDDMWVATRYGINRYDHAHDRFINHNTAPEYRFAADNNLTRILAASDGSLWLVNRTTNIWKAHISGDHLIAEPLYIDRHRNFYASTVISMVGGVGDVLWIGTEGGLYTVNIHSGAYRKIVYTTDSYGLASNQVFKVYSDHYGDMWICTDIGVHRFHSRTNYIRHFSHSPLDTSTVSHQKIRSLLQYGGQLLVGTGGGGLDISRGDRFRHHINPYYSSSPVLLDILSNTLNVLYRLRDGTVLAGTNSGLYRIDPETGKFYKLPYSVFGSRVWSICEDREGILWIGTLFKGLTRIDRRTGDVRYYFAEVRASRLAVPVSVHTIYEARDGTLWIGTNNGLYRMDRNTNQPVWTVWNSPDSSSASHNHVWPIHETNNGKLWIGTTGGGLNLFDPSTGKYVHYGREQGLPSDIICGILEDGHGNLWVSTNTGLCRFTPSNGRVTTFGIDDGVYISDFHVKTCFRDASGVMYFGGTGGYLCFHPDSMSIKTRPRRLIFTSFKVFDRKLALDTALLFKKQMILPYNSNYFSVEFVSVDFAGAHHHQYRYKLDSYDRQWRYTDGTHPLAGYTDVAPGNYNLVVEVADDEGNWGSNRAAIGIRITPAWWQTWWFQMAVLLCLVAIGVGLLRWYLGSMRRKGAMERRLVELQLHALRAQMNPHFIFNSLNSIYYYILCRDQKKAQTYLGLFSVLLRRILEYSRKTFIPINREIEILDMYLQLEAMRFSQRFGYKMSIAPDIDLERQLVPTMLLQPYVENAVKHGLLPKEKDCMLTIEFQRRGDRIECSITDNGIGRKMAGQIREQSQLPYTSQGLALSKERMDNLSELHGKLYGVEVQDLTTETGEALGTRIVLTFPADVDATTMGVFPRESI